MSPSSSGRTSHLQQYGQSIADLSRETPVRLRPVAPTKLNNDFKDSAIMGQYWKAVNLDDYEDISERVRAAVARVLDK